LFGIQCRLLPVRLKTVRDVVEHHSNVVRHTARLQQGNIMHTAHDTGVLMYGVGLDHVQSFLHRRKRDGDVLRLQTRTGRQLQCGRHTAVQTPVDILFTRRSFYRERDIHIILVAAICHTVTYVVGGFHRHRDHCHTGGGRFTQRLAPVGGAGLDLDRVSGGILQVFGHIKGVCLSGSHTCKLRILEVGKYR